jgi:hypothetical protein
MSNMEERSSNDEWRGYARGVKGWGADLDPANRPAVPKEKPSDVTTPYGAMQEKQIPEIRIHQSIEHEQLTPVFGTSCPPRGLSGRLRDFAYTYSEGALTHWLTLMLADRVDVLEGTFEDLAHGHLPNTYKERGWTAPGSSRERWRRNARVAGGVLAIAALTYALWPKEEAR